MADLTTEEKREFLVTDLLTVWEKSEDPVAKKVWTALVAIMVFVGGYEDFAGADKKEEAVAILELLLEKTDSPGPDFVVDPAIVWAVEYGIDALYDAFKGKFAFDGGS